MKKLLVIAAAILATIAADWGIRVVNFTLGLVAIALAVVVVWGLNVALGAPWYLVFVAVPAALLAIWPLAKLIDRID